VCLPQNFVFLADDPNERSQPIGHQLNQPSFRKLLLNKAGQMLKSSNQNSKTKAPKRIIDWQPKRQNHAHPLCHTQKEAGGIDAGQSCNKTHQKRGYPV
jgi:hypothetical protein